MGRCHRRLPAAPLAAPLRYPTSSYYSLCLHYRASKCVTHELFIKDVRLQLLCGWWLQYTAHCEIACVVEPSESYGSRWYSFPRMPVEYSSAARRNANGMHGKVCAAAAAAAVDRCRRLCAASVVAACAPVETARHRTRAPWYYHPSEDERFGKVEASWGAWQV